jgi:ATP-dependent DNA helicase RecQ
LGEFEEVDDPLVIGQKILSSVYRQQESFGADYTTKVLRGSKEQRICNNGHDRLSTHGLLEGESRRAILDWIGQLTQQEFLRKEGKYNTLKITEQGWRLLRGEVTPRLLKPAREAKASRVKVKHDPRSWEGVDRGLFEELRKLRTERAVELGFAPYMVFGDASLRDMARRRPTNAERFLDVHGVGQKKCDDYAAAFTAAISRYCQDYGLDADIDPLAPGIPRGSDKHSKGSTSTNEEPQSPGTDGV